jgi:hypothetical protein
LLIKLVLLGLIDSDPRELLQLQRARLEPIAGALAVERCAVTGYDHMLALWRYESISATLRFLDALLATAPAR